MKNEADYVKVGGTFSTYSYSNHTTNLTAGTLEVKGDFIQRSHSYSDYRYNFTAGGSHKVILSGTESQKVDFQYPGPSHFNTLEIKNTSGQVTFASALNVNKLITNGNTLPFLTISPMNWTLNEDTVVTGNLNLAGSSIDLNGYKLTIQGSLMQAAGNVNVNGVMLNVQGSLIQTGGTMNINGGQLIVDKDYRIENSGSYVWAALVMTNALDYVKVGGSFTTYAYDNHSSYLTAGTMEVKGDFIQRSSSYSEYRYNFTASGTHKVILSGTTEQKIDFQYPDTSHFNILEIRNIKAKVIFVSPINTNKLINNGNILSAITVSSMNWKLYEDTIIEGSLNLTGSSIDLNGYKLTAKGSLVQTGGTLNINGGQLIVEKDFRIENNGSYVWAVLAMTNKEDYVRVDGTFTTYSYNNHLGSLTAGTMEVKGDFIVRAASYSDYRYNFAASGTHKVILSGSNVQKVDFQYPGTSKFNILQITKPIDTGYVFNSKPVWNQLVEAPLDSEPPTIPTNLKVLDKSHYTITLTWEPSVDNVKMSGYLIYRDGSMVGGASGTSFTDRGLEPDCEYTYTIKAFDIFGNESELSELVKDKTYSDPEPPNQPKGLKTVSKSDKSITISWEAASDNVGVTGYVVYRDKKMVTTTGELTFTDKGLSPSTIYSYQIKAFDAMKNYSEYSVPLFEKTAGDIDVPTTPGKPIVSEVTVKTVKITWEKSSDNFAVKGYEIYRDDKIIGTTPENVFTDKELKPDTTYKYYVRAFDDALNYSSVSDSVYAITEKDIVAPTIPVNVMLSSKTAASVTISWDKSSDNVAVKEYNIYRDGNNLIATTDKLSYTDNGLTQDKTYTYAVKAVDASGNESGASSVLTCTPSIPDAPADVKVDAGIYSLDISWSPVKSDGVSYYKVYAGVDGTRLDFWTNVKNGTKATRNEILSGTTMYFAISAVDIWGNEGSMTKVSGTTSTDSISPKVTLFQPADGSRLSNRYVALKANGTDNGIISKFIFESSGDSGNTWAKVGEVDASYDQEAKEFKGQTLFSNDGISGKYLFRVTAFDKEGNKSEIVTYTITLDYTAPEVPKGVTAIAAAGRNVISWDKVTTEDISKYRIYRKKGNESYTRIETLGSNICNFNDYNAEIGQTYEYAVSSIDDLGNESALSESVQVTTVNFSPTLLLTPQKAGPEAQISFSGKGFKPLEAVDLYIDGIYLVSGKADQNGDVIITWRYVKNVTPGEHNFALKGKASLTQAESGFTALVDLLEAPTGLMVSSGQIEINLSWIAPKGTNIGYYRVYRKAGSDEPTVIFDNIKGTSIKDINVLKDVDYYYQVSAVDIYGNEGSISAFINARPMPDSESPTITSLTASRSGDVLKLSYGVKDNVGVTIIKLFYKKGLDEWKDIGVGELPPQRNTIHSSHYEWNTKDIPDGIYEIKAVAYDAEGNNSQENKINITIRNTPPDAPSKLTAAAGELKVDLSWTEVLDSELDKYSIFRSTDGINFEFLVKTSLLSYTDTKVGVGSTYIYKVIAIDKYGHESKPAFSEEVKVKADMTPPVVKGIIPQDGSKLKGRVNLSAIAVDNFHVKNIEFFYASNSDNSRWVSLGSTATGTITWDTAATVTDGVYEIKVVAQDDYLNKGEMIAIYTIDNTPPGMPLLAASSSELKVSLAWQAKDTDSDINYFEVWRGTDAADPGSFKQIARVEGYVYVDSAAPLDKDSFYKIIAVDKMGNKSEGSNIEKLRPGNDLTAPVIDKFEPAGGSVLRGKAEIRLHAKDNVEVKTYEVYIRKLDDNGKPQGTGDWSIFATVDNRSQNDAVLSWDTLMVSTEGEESYPDGTYEVKVVVADKNNNKSQRIETYILANNPPAAPEKIYAAAEEWRLIVSWSPVVRSDFDHYVLYRKEGKNGEWKKIVSNTTSNLYVDYMKDPSKDYYYRVSVVNDLGRESALSYDYSKDTQIDPKISTHALQETTKPFIAEMKPAEMSRWNYSIPLKAVINDPVAVKVLYEYAYLGESIDSILTGDETWQLIGEDVLPQFEDPSLNSGIDLTNTFNSEIDFDVSGKPAGGYAVRITAINKGNIEASFIKKYIIDREAPATPKGLYAEDPKTGGELGLAWQKSSSEDIDHYEVMRSLNSGGPFTTVAKSRSLVYRDTGLVNGSVYFYIVKGVDSAGNVSDVSNQVSGIPTAVCDLFVKEITFNPEVPAYGKSSVVSAFVENNGYARAKGTVTFYIRTGDWWKQLGSTNIEVNALTKAEAGINWIPDNSITGPVKIKAVAAISGDISDTDESNNLKEAECSLNYAPTAAVESPLEVNSGEIFTLKGLLSKDSDGSITAYKWNMGDGSLKEGAQVTHMYQTPGKYQVTLTVMDNDGADGQVSTWVTVNDNRPDLVVSEIKWSPKDPEENDVVSITATIGNLGKGPSTLGFLAGFYIDNQYVGYTRVDRNIEKGAGTDVTFSWVATPGVHIVKVVANDILDNLKEISKSNNTATAVLTSKQVSFPDIRVDKITWSPDKLDLNSESPFVYRATISNIGNANAEKFFVSLYIDGKWVLKQNVNLLSPGLSQELVFSVKPVSGKHEITIKADDPAPILVEPVRDNNIKTVTTSEFTVTYPTLSLGPITWMPKETTLTDGTSLTYETKLVNTSSIDITHKFKVDFKVDGQVIKSFNIDKLNAGEEKDLWTRWYVQPGPHTVSITADPDSTVTNSAYGASVEALVPNLNIIYPDLNITDVQWSPLNIRYGEPHSFVVRVSNQSVTSVFNKFNIGLYVDGKAVAGSAVEGLRGHSTAIVGITWTPQDTGIHNVKIVVDNFNEIRQAPVSEGVKRSWERSFDVADRLVVEAHPNEKDMSEELGYVLTSLVEDFMPMTVSCIKASDKNKLLGPESGIYAQYELKKNDEVALSGIIGFDPVSRTYKGQLPLKLLKPGIYTLSIEAGDAVESYTTTCNLGVLLQKDCDITIETEKQNYNANDIVHISGYFKYKDGKPLANSKLILDLQLEPESDDPRKPWKAEHILTLETDENGHYKHDFIPITAEAGKWNAYVLAFDKMLSGAGFTTFTVYGMAASPSNLSITASKNSQFSRVISIKNTADSGETSLTGINAVLRNLTPDSKVSAVIDKSTLNTTLNPGSSSSVVINFNAPLNVSDTAEYEIVFSSSQGPSTNSRIKLNLRPAVPIPVTDPKGIDVGVNPGKNIERTVKITNKGLGAMSNIRLEAPVSIPWIKPFGLGKTSLAPGEETKFNISINPTQGTALGQYQDVITVTDGKYKAVVTVAAEVSTTDTGSVSFLVTDDSGAHVAGAEINLVGKDPYIQSRNGQEITYYQHFYGRTDANGIVTFEDKPIGEYAYYVQAQGRTKISGTAHIMPKSEASMVEVKMEVMPVQIEWTVVPTTIQDKYDIKLEMNFSPVNIPKPKFGLVPPWMTIPKQVTGPVYLEATVINTGMVPIIDAVASVIRENSKDTGISIVGGGYIGEIPAHGSTKIKLLVEPGYYNLKFGIKDLGQEEKAPNRIYIMGNYISFDNDTGLPMDPPGKVETSLALCNPGEQKARVEISLPGDSSPKEEEIQMPEGQIEELDYLNSMDGFGGGSGDSGNVNGIITLKLDQTATLERQAFNATLKVTNGYPVYSLQNLSVRVQITDTDGNDVTNKNFIIPTSLSGISNLDGSSSLASGQGMLSTWQLIPGEGLGGTDPSGKIYLAKAVISYYLNGKYVETSTKAEEITIYPQPKIKLHYYIPQKITAGVPFRLGIIAENTGDGIARNLTVESGQLEISSNRIGLETNFKIIGTSFGSSTDASFKISLGDIKPHSKVSGYWMVRWEMFEEGPDAKPLEGEFKNFRATLNHRDYKGVQLNPLIVGVTTEIIGQDNVLPDPYVPSNSLTLINVGDTGFPSYLLNLNTGTQIPIYVPQSLNILKQPGEGESILKFEVPALLGDPDAQGAPRYQVLMLKDPMPKANISSVTREVYAGKNYIVNVGKVNSWKSNGNIYIVDEIPIYDVKPLGISGVQARYYHKPAYTVDFRSGAIINTVEYSQIIFDVDQKDLDKIKKKVYYDVGHYPDEGDTLTIRAKVENKGNDAESGIVEFFAAGGDIKGEIKIGQASFSGLQPLFTTYVYLDWTYDKGGIYNVTARILGSTAKEASKDTAIRINSKPYADAGVDFSEDVLKPAHFDGSRSYDRDGYIQSYIWEFGDGESSSGVTPTHKYLHSGTYKVNLTVTDNNGAETISQMQITVNETRADLRITDIVLDNDSPKEGENVSVTGSVYNTGYMETDKPFLVGFYVDGVYKDYVKISEKIKPGETKKISFSWKNTVGNHMLTIVANDMGHPVDEADFHNNQLSRALDTKAAFFPNLKVAEATWSGNEEGILDWNQEVSLAVTVENNGSYKAGKFSVALFENGELVNTQAVSGLSHSEGSNKVTLIFKINAVKEGIHKYRIVADGPIPHIVEGNKSDNEKEITTPKIRFRYPDLKVEKLTCNPEDGNLQPGQPIVITASILNSGYAAVNKGFKVNFYADDAYIGTKECESLAVGQRSFVSLSWNRPVPGTQFIEAVVDEGNEICEAVEIKDIGNNDTSLGISPATGEDNNRTRFIYSKLNVQLPDLVVEGIENSPANGTVLFGETVTSIVHLKNKGNATVNKPFTTTLYVNEKLAGRFETTKPMQPGDTAAGVITWNAGYTPTSVDYKITAYADAYSSIYLKNRDNAKYTMDYKVKGVLTLKADKLNDAYTVEEKPLIGVSVTSTDEPWRPLGTKESVTASVYMYQVSGNGTGLNPEDLKFIKGMNYNLAEGKFQFRVNSEGSDTKLPSGIYNAVISVFYEAEQKSVIVPLRFIEDYRVTAFAAKQTFGPDEPIEISGSVTQKDGITPIPGADVTITVVGEEEWKANVKADGEGKFKYLLQIDEGYGGTYSLSAGAKVNGAAKASDPTTFYIEGLVVKAKQKTELTSGYATDIPVTVGNVGTLPLTGLKISKKWLTDSEGMSVEIIGDVPKVLDAGKSIDVKLRVDFADTVDPGAKYLEFTVNSEEGYSKSITFEVYAAKAVAVQKVEILVGQDDKERGIIKNEISASLKPGNTVTQLMRITNTGTAPIKDINVIGPKKLPWVYITTSGTDLVLPLNKGLSLRDKNGHAAVNVNISPDEYVQNGIYNDVITIKSNGGTTEIPINLYVGASSIGTVVIQALDEDSYLVGNAKVELIGPMTAKGLQSVKSELYVPVQGKDSTFKFENIPSGVYTLKVEAPYHKALETSFEVPAVIDFEPQKVKLETMPFSFDWNVETIKEAENTEGQLTEPVIETLLGPAPIIPRLVSNVPGYEIYTSQMLRNMYTVVAIKNQSVFESVYNVEAQLIYNDETMPDGYAILDKGAVNSKTLQLGDFKAGEIKDFKIYIDDPKMYDIATVEVTEENGIYLVKVPAGVTVKQFDYWLKGQNSTSREQIYKLSYDADKSTFKIRYSDGGENKYPGSSIWLPKCYGKNYKFSLSLVLKGTRDNGYGYEEPVSLKVPVRVFYKPYDMWCEEYSDYDENTVPIKAAFNPERLKDTGLRIYHLSKSFVDYIGIDTPDEPEKMGEALGSFEFSQGAVQSDEVFGTSFVLYNPSKLDEIKDASLELVITDKELDSDGRLPEGAKLLNKYFNIYCSQNLKDEDGNPALSTTQTDRVYVDLLAPNSKEEFGFRLQRKTDEMDYGENPGNGMGKTYIYVRYNFKKGKDTVNGVTKPRIVEIEPPSKIYLSYEFEKISDSIYEITAKATNAGLGKSRGLKLLPPRIRCSENVNILMGKVGDGPWDYNVTYLQLGDILPGKTATAKYRISTTGPVDLAQSTNFEIVEQKSSGKIVITPLRFDKVTGPGEFIELERQLERLKGNMGVLIGKNTDDLARAMSDTMEYVKDLDANRRFSAVLDIINSGFGVIFSSLNMLLSVKDLARSASDNALNIGEAANSYRVGNSLANGKIIENVNKALKIVNTVSDAANKLITAKGIYDNFMALLTEVESKVESEYNEEVLGKILEVTKTYSDTYITTDAEAGFPLEGLKRYVDAQKQQDKSIVTNGNVVYLSDRFINEWKRDHNYSTASDISKFYRVGTTTIVTEGNYSRWRTSQGTAGQGGSTVPNNDRSAQLDRLRDNVTAIRQDVGRSQENIARIREEAKAYYSSGSTPIQLDPGIIRDIENAPGDEGVYRDGNTVYITRDYIDRWKIRNGKQTADSGEIITPRRDGNVIYVPESYWGNPDRNVSTSVEGLEDAKRRLQPALDDIKSSMDAIDAKNAELNKKLSQSADNLMGVMDSALSYCKSLVDLGNALQRIETIRYNLDNFIGEANEALQEAIDSATQTEQQPDEAEDKEEERNYGNVYSVLFTGDVMEDAENALIENLRATNGLDKLNSDTLKVAHHGGKDSTIMEFLQGVSPDESVISVGEVNDYNHPHSETISRLDASGTTTYMTDENGNVETYIYNKSTNQLAAKVSFLDVDQGDCILIEAGGNKMLIDAGAGKARYPLKKANFSRIDAIDSLKYLVVTHPDSDHYNYLNKRLFLQNGTPINVTESVFVPMVDNTVTTDAYNEFERNIKTRYANKYIVVGSDMVGRTFSLDDQGEISFEILGPVRNFYATGSNKAEKSNNSSIILKMIYTPRNQTSGDNTDNGIRIVTHYTVMEGGRPVPRQNIRDIVGMGTISRNDISRFVNRQQENSTIMANRGNFQSILDNGLGSMQDLDVNNTDAVRQRLSAALERMVSQQRKSSSSGVTEGTYSMGAPIDVQGRLDEIMRGMPENTYQRTTYIIKAFLEMEIYNVLTTNNMYQAYEEYLNGDHNYDEAFEDIDGFDMSVSPDLKLRKEYISKDIGNLRQISDSMIDHSINIVRGYMLGGDTPSYYPTDVLIKYFKDLNDQIESIAGTETDPYKGFGRYKNVSIINSNGDEVHPENKDLSIMKDRYLKLLEDTGKGYGVISDRANFNVTKASVYTINAILQPYNFVMGLHPVGALVTLPVSLYYDTLVEAMNDTEMSIYNRESLITKKISGSLANMVVGTGLSYTRSLGITEAANNIINNVDKWRKIDPPLPVNVESISVRDVIVKLGDKEGIGEAVLVLKNSHTGEVSALANMDIYGGKLLYGSVASETVSIKPGETVEIKIPFTVQRSTLADISGYKSIFTIKLSEPGTMTIGDPKGPYITHFYAGNEKQLASLRKNIKVVQPMGRNIKGGEEDVKEFVPGSNAKELRFLVAGKIPSKLELHVYDKYGNHVGVKGVSYENNISNCEVSSLRNNNDMLVINNPDKGPYRIVVKLPEGESEQEYSLEIVELNNIGAVPDVNIAKVILSDSKKPQFTVNVLESSYQNNIDKVLFKVLDFKDAEGKDIEIVASSFKGQDGTDVTGGILTGVPKGMQAVLMTSIEFKDSLPDGIYNGKVRVTVKGKNLNPDFGMFIESMSVTDSVYGWKYTGGENDVPYSLGYSEYCIDIPVSIIIDTKAPADPKVENVDKYMLDNRCQVQITGTADEGDYVEAYIDGRLAQKVITGKDRKFDIIVSLEEGNHNLEIISTNIFGARSTSGYKAVISGSDIGNLDTTPPILTVPADITLEATDILTPVDIGNATATDASKVTITNDAPALFPIGITVVTWTAVDESGNKTTSTQKVTVNERMREHTISGYISTDIRNIMESTGINEGFKVEVLGTDSYATTKKDGSFIITNLKESISGYTLRVSKPGYLYRDIKIMNLTSDVTVSSKEQPVTLWAGDIKSDNVINMEDVIKIAVEFNTNSRDAGFKYEYDLNKDNAINIMDFIAIARNFNANPDDYPKISL
jgi:beta-lactamase superfamily II metal-dependent hydrolase/chitodextrinase